MTVINIDGLLEPVRKAPSEGDALRQLLLAQEIALQALKRLAEGAAGAADPRTKAKVDDVINEIDGLLGNMMINSPKVDATLRDARTKRPIDPSPMELLQEQEQRRAAAPPYQHGATEQHRDAEQKTKR
jgi:hypothetical protein